MKAKYIAIALELRHVRPGNIGPRELRAVSDDVWTRSCAAVANALGLYDDKFPRAKFIDMCES